MFPTHLFNARDHAAFLFYENDPGVPVPRANDLKYVPDKTATPPEWAWWDFNIDDLTAGKADLMKSLMNATRCEPRALPLRKQRQADSLARLERRRRSARTDEGLLRRGRRNNLRRRSRGGT
jgi:hypothetical protein